MEIIISFVQGEMIMFGLYERRFITSNGNEIELQKVWKSL